MSRALVVLVALLTVGCGTRPNDPPLPPQDSAAGRSVIPSGEGRDAWPGHPDRRSAGLWRVVRGGAEVQVSYFTCFNGRCSVQLMVKTRNTDQLLAFANWTRPDQATLKDAAGRSYSLCPPSRAVQDWEQGAPDPRYGRGPGPVTHDRARLTYLEFDEPARESEYLDLDLDGGPIGTTDPILFRIPREMAATLGSP